ncbi:hypothetical protein QQ008_13885 [Fulvivirgaceae bacterium BMA10]|uniref:DUF2207 domain-containing protein n=1 Tax=Splendidivirga corallicola TaxID=3051826 RepID=A0ABT8KR40_9BACT|nr:hypothetical protein [Fulvivirgaceae bacterium BMA10]
MKRTLLISLTFILALVHFSNGQKMDTVRLFIADFAGDDFINDKDSLILYYKGIYETIEKEEWDLSNIDIAINDISLAEITPRRFSKSITKDNITYDSDLLLYKIKKSDISTEKLEEIRNLKDLRQVYLTIELPDDAIINEVTKLTPLLNNAGWRQIVAILVSIAIVGIISILVLSGGLRDETSPDVQVEKAPYSFSRTQIFWWSTIVASTIAYVFIMTNDFSINETAWILLGITGTTLGLSFAIDKSDIAKDDIKKRIQDNESEGWFKDILKDSSGNISIHRLQAFIFNLGFGIYYILIVLQSLKLPSFDSDIFILLGLSSGAYAFVKQNENKGLS